MNHDEYRKMRHLEETHWWFAARRDLLCRALDRYATRPGSNLRLLDVGCGTGGTLERLKPYGVAVGVDLEPLALRFCRERGLPHLVCASATALPFADNAFDVAVALDVLEHIPDHRAAAGEIARVLKPGGVLFATVPAYRALWSGHDDALMHQRRYVAREVSELLTGAGLRVEHLTYTVTAPLPVAFVLRRTSRLLRPHAPPRADVAPTRPLLNRFLRGLLNMEGRWAVRRRVPLGLTVFAVGRKP